MFHDGICLNAGSEYPALLGCCCSSCTVVWLFGCSSRWRHFHVVNIQGRAPENERKKKEETRGENNTEPTRNRIIFMKNIFPDGENFLFFVYFFLCNQLRILYFYEGAKILFQSKIRSCRFFYWLGRFVRFNKISVEFSVSSTCIRLTSLESCPISYAVICWRFS
jgi:hypothetical protein